MSSPAHYSEIDTRRFGKRIYRAEVQTVVGVQALGDFAAEEYVDMIIARCPAAELRTVHALESAGYRLMDTLVHYSGRTEGLRNATFPHAIRRATVADREGLRAVAFDAFANYDGHYHADPKLDPALATLGYVDWCLSGIDAEGQATWVVTMEGAIAGFIAVKHEGATACITLNGVASRFQRRGAYDSLFKAALRSLANDGIPEVTVSTHVNNLAPQRVWVRNGMTMVRVLYTFHKWFDA